MNVCCSRFVILHIWNYDVCTISDTLEDLSLSFYRILSLTSLSDDAHFKISFYISGTLLGFAFSIVDVPHWALWFTSGKRRTRAPFVSRFSLRPNLADHSYRYVWDHGCVLASIASFYVWRSHFWEMMTLTFIFSHVWRQYRSRYCFQVLITIPIEIDVELWLD